jgi:hypothetical protein
MRLRPKHYLPGLAVILLAAPLWAHTESVEMQINHPVTIAGKQLNPGDYNFKVKDAAKQVDVMRDGNVVAQVACNWVQLSKKAPYSDVQFTKDQITEIDFGGKTEAVKFR